MGQVRTLVGLQKPLVKHWMKHPQQQTLRTITEEVLNPSVYLAIDTIPVKFMHKVWMANLVKCFDKVQNTNVGLQSCLHLLLTTGMSLTRSISCVSQDRRARKTCSNGYRILYLLACSMIPYTTADNMLH